MGQQGLKHKQGNEGTEMASGEKIINDKGPGIKSTRGRILWGVHQEFEEGEY
jgi:hypothetical protein